MTIGLTYTGSPEKHLNYEKWLKGSQPETIEVIQLSAEEKNENKISGCDALVLSGGIDIHPKFYQETKTDYPDSPPDFDEKRDEFEITAFQEAQQKNIPVLGICRGMQLINIIYHGTLQQDLGQALNIIHRATAIRDKKHDLNIKANTIINEISAGRSVVNSAHHQSIQRVGDGLKVSCTAADGTIEAVERVDPSGKPFLLGVQWHPERMYGYGLQNSSFSKALRDRFIEAVRKTENAGYHI